MIKPLFVVTFAFAVLLLFSHTPESTLKVEAGSAFPQEFENYDIRTDVSAREKLKSLRNGEDLKALINDSPDVGIENNHDLGVVETITKTQGRMLGSVGGRTRAQALREFVLGDAGRFGIGSVDQLVETADYSNPDGNLSFARLEQRIGEIAVFGAEVTAGFTRKGQLFRVVNSLARDVRAESIGRDFGSVNDAVIRASEQVGIVVAVNDLVRSHSRDGKIRFSINAISDPVEAERFYFPVGNGFLRPSWRVLLTSDRFAYYVIVDAQDGTLLWRKNVFHSQSVAATYNVYGNTGSQLKTADSPSPFSPGCTSPLSCPQPPAILRSNFSLIGNEAPYTFNNLGWIPDTGLDVRTPANPNITDGNNVEAGIDRMAPTGIDDNGWAFGNPTRFFSHAYNPAPGTPPPGDEPLPPGPQPYPPTSFQQGVITHGFYLANRWHDEMYRLGFTEQARNFQHYNFGRGGVEGDRFMLEVQDFSATAGANSTILADGGRPRTQMFVWSFPTPKRDGVLDSQMVVHELTHGTTSRVHGNIAGLSSNMGRAMAEGWSDFYAIALLSEPGDDRLGTHAFSGYIAYQINPGFESNYYYGLRRFPYAILASRGPNGLPHNPLTFKYVNANCDTYIGTTSTNPSSAYPRNPVISTSSGVQQCDQIHNMGEVWAVTLWEVRDQLIGRHGAAEGNRRVMQYVLDGMKLSPLNPTVLQARDSILVAASVSDAADVAPLRRGFAIRGLGVSASIQNVGSGNNNTVVTEAFDIPAQMRRPTRSDFDGDGRTDVSVFRSSDRNWYLNRSTAGFAVVNWGLSTDVPVPDDYDGDGKTDVAIFRATEDPGSPDFYILRSSDSTVSYISWGTTGDIPLSEDMDGDDKADPIIYRASTQSVWFLGGTRFAGQGTPIVGDFDGDGRGDYGTFSSGFWRIEYSGDGVNGLRGFTWGFAGDQPTHADYDADGRDDLAVYRPDGVWYIQNSNGGTQNVRFGNATDIPAPGDFDGDGKADIANYRDGVWWILPTTGGMNVVSFGLAGDMPTPATYLR